MKPAGRADQAFDPQGEDPPQESRRHARRRISVPIEFALGDKERRAGICRDIGLGGMHVDTAEPAPFGSSVIIFVRLPGMENEAALPGIVRWTGPGCMGIQLGSYGARVTHAIIRILSDP
jgi:hypothetical protein